MSQILTTFKFRKPLSGIGNMLKVANRLLDSGVYRIRSPLNPLHPKHLYLEIFQSASSTHATLRLDLPLDCSCDETQIKEIVQQLEKPKSCLRFMADADSISIVSELIPAAESPNTSTDYPEFVFKHTFELRKPPTTIMDELLSSISSMVAYEENNLICAFDAQTHRCLQINVFVNGIRHPVCICSRRLKSPKKTDWNIVSQINLASSYNAPIQLGYSEDSQAISVYVGEPADSDASSRMRLALSQIQ